MLGGQEAFAELDNPLAVVAIGKASIRANVVERCSSVDWIQICHAHSFVDATVRVGEGTVIFAGVVVQPDTVIGKHSIINTGATVDHDCHIGDYVHICPGVNLAGDVTVGKGTWVGIGSQVIQGIRIGSNSVIGAGVTVIHDVPDNVVAVGTPAKIRSKND